MGARRGLRLGLLVAGLPGELMKMLPLRAMRTLPAVAEDMVSKQVPGVNSFTPTTRPRDRTAQC